MFWKGSNQFSGVYFWCFVFIVYKIEGTNLPHRVSSAQTKDILDLTMTFLHALWAYDIYLRNIDEF